MEILISFIWRNFTIEFQGEFTVALNHAGPYLHLPSTNNFVLLSLEVKKVTSVKNANRCS